MSWQNYGGEPIPSKQDLSAAEKARNAFEATYRADVTRAFKDAKSEESEADVVGSVLGTLFNEYRNATEPIPPEAIAAAIDSRIEELSGF